MPKYHRGRSLAWDRTRELRSELLNWQEGHSEVNDEESNPHSNRNQGNRVTGPCVIGLYESNQNVRFVVLPDRRDFTLFSLIQEYLEE